ncbi:MAG: radical SAM protein [Candidatus Gracilibacteria bacterium]|nr:radical SAM protein [Candidatus Gracilibacteria bacterium]
MELIYILTYNCNFRCKYCDVYKHNNSISEDIIKQSLIFLEKNNFEINKVKFFGGEPLLKKDFIKDIIKDFPSKYNPNFFVTTNSTLIDQNFINFSKKKNINLTFSIDGDVEANIENRILETGDNLSKNIIRNTQKYADFIRVNQVITSKNSKDFFKNFKFIYDLGVRNFNFLPAYYVNWTKTGLKDLKKGFDEILNFYKSGNDFELVNLDNYSEISFFNLGIIIDTDGSIYGTNLILSGNFEKYKKELVLGTIFDEIFIDISNKIFIENYINKISKILEKEYSSEVLISVKYVDLILNNFCNEYKTYRNKYMKSM